jgi:hypothetical protein
MGNTIPGSVPLAKISPSLANPHAVHYRISKSQSCLGISPAPDLKGGLAFIKAFIAKQSELDTLFLIDSSLYGPTYLTFQTPWMKERLHDAVNSWHNFSMETHLTGRHGYVTDGDHSYFLEGTLNVTCAYDLIMLAWLPVLYTWILRLDTVHHRLHFQTIAKQVTGYTEHNNIPFDKKFLLQVYQTLASK